MVRPNITDGTYITLRDDKNWDRIEDLTITNEDVCLVLEVRNIIWDKNHPYQEIKILTPNNHIGWLTDQNLVIINGLQ